MLTRSKRQLAKRGLRGAELHDIVRQVQAEDDGSISPQTKIFSRNLSNVQYSNEQLRKKKRMSWWQWLQKEYFLQEEISQFSTCMGIEQTSEQRNVQYKGPESLFSTLSKRVMYRMERARVIGKKKWGTWQSKTDSPMKNPAVKKCYVNLINFYQVMEELNDKHSNHKFGDPVFFSDGTVKLNRKHPHVKTSRKNKPLREENPYEEHRFRRVRRKVS